jgi:hypothetical protein
LGLDQTVRVEHVTVNEGGQAIVARAAYARVRPLYKRLAQEVRHILETKLADAGLTTVSITTGQRTSTASPRRLDALPASPATVAAFLAHEASSNVKASTIGRRTAAIRYAHKFAGLATPTDDELVKATVRGIRRTLGTAKVKKAPATAERLVAMAANTGADGGQTGH